MRKVPLADGWRFALVDDQDYELVVQYQWYYVPAKPGHDVGYADRRWRIGGRQRSQRMHTLITGWRLVDHKDRDGLNNQRSNLRRATVAQNQMNRRPNSGCRFKGVKRNKGRWLARIQVNGHSLYLGSFATAEEAAAAYDTAAAEAFGEFARINGVAG